MFTFYKVLTGVYGCCNNINIQESAWGRKSGTGSNSISSTLSNLVFVLPDLITMIRIPVTVVMIAVAVVIFCTALTPQASHLGRCIVIADSAPMSDDTGSLQANLEKGTICLVRSRGMKLYDDTGTPPEPGDCISGYHRYRVTCGERKGWVLGKDIALETGSPLFKGKEREYFKKIGAVDKNDFDIDGDKKGDSLWYAASLWFSQEMNHLEVFSWIIDFGTEVHPVITLSKSKKKPVH